jgi:hypothetical protein
VQAISGDVICEGRAIRIHAKIKDDGNLEAHPIPDYIRQALTQSSGLIQLPDEEG